MADNSMTASSITKEIPMRFWRVLINLILFIAIGIPVYGASINLSPEEKAWIEKNRTIRISGPKAFPPFQFIDADGSFKGMATDYVSIIADMTGLKIEVVKGLSWPEVLERVDRKEIDLLTCAGRTPDREKSLIFLKPHLSYPLVIITKKDFALKNGIKGLNMRTIAFVKKNAAYEWLIRDGIVFTTDFVDTPLDALKSVSPGNADATIDNLASATYQIEKSGLMNLKVAAPTSYDNYELSIAVRKDLSVLAGIFEKGMAAIDQDKHSEIRRKWLAVRYEYGISAIDVAKWVLAVILFLFTPLCVFFFWNRKLSREIVIRKRIEAENEALINDLTRALQEIKTLKGILPLCSFCKKIRNESGQWENVDTYIHNHSQADISHSICPECLRKNYPEEYRDMSL